VGGNAQAGAPSAGGSTAEGGSGADGSVPKGSPAAVQNACTAFCDAFSHCPEDEGGFGADCEQSCFGLGYRAGSATCTATGIDMLACFTLAVQAHQPACSDAFIFAIQECADAVDAYRECPSDFVPPSRTGMLCVQTSMPGSGQSSSCFYKVDCLNKLDGESARRSVTYDINCVDTDDGQSSCTCQSPSLVKSFTVSETTVDACQQNICTDP
jgi:hypothetical protein